MKILRIIPLILTLTLVTGCHRAKRVIHHATSSEPDDTPQIEALLTSAHVDGMKYADISDMQGGATALYDVRDFDLVWLKGGKPTPQAEAMMSAISNAMSRGLRPADYDASEWSTRVQNLGTPEGAAAFDVALTVDSMRFLSDLHGGRVPPSYFAFGVKGYESRRFDAVTLLNEHILDATDVESAVNSAEPQVAQYQALKKAMAHYIDLAAQDRIAMLPDMQKGAKPLALNGSYPALQPLAQRLVLLGDTPALDLNTLNGNNPDTIAALTDGLRHFQHRHGLDEDGKLSPNTVDALNVPITQRITSIADSMERWRWLDDDHQNAAIIVNLPEFQLRAYEGTGDDHHEVFRMNVVDGKSDDETHHTPVIADTMKYVVFRPYWNVPPSIAKKEIIPHMQKTAGYLGQKNYEVVNMKGEVQAADMHRIEQGAQMVRQKAGTSNSLGLVKFMFPNPFNVYLHDTNEKALFTRTRRDYSHGCVRLQDPPKLANWVFRDNSKWDADAIATAMNSGDDNKTVSLPKPIPVVIFYATAWSDDGEIHFFKDMYDYDGDMEKALDKGRPYPTKPGKAVTEKDV